MDLSTTYLGLPLSQPLLPGASPLAQDLGLVRRLEDSGAAALVLRSLFEEQIVAQEHSVVGHLDAHENLFAESLSYFPGIERVGLDPDRYLEQLRRIKEAIRIPVIASLNGAGPGSWLDFAKLLHQAGADAIELNVYAVATDADDDAMAVEQRVIAMLADIRRHLPIPVAVKLSPFYTSLPHFAQRLEGAGADGLVLFNRFYEPDIDLERLEIAHQLRLSTPTELLLRLRWLGILSGQLRCSLAVAGGVHTALDAIKAVVAGADAVQVVSALLHGGPGTLGQLIADMARWLEDHEYESLGQLRGSLSLAHCPDPQTYERASYLEMLTGWGH